MQNELDVADAADVSVINDALTVSPHSRILCVFVIHGEAFFVQIHLFPLFTDGETDIDLAPRYFAEKNEQSIAAHGYRGKKDKPFDITASDDLIEHFAAEEDGVIMA